MLLGRGAWNSSSAQVRPRVEAVPLPRLRARTSRLRRPTGSSITTSRPALALVRSEADRRGNAAASGENFSGPWEGAVAPARPETLRRGLAGASALQSIFPQCPHPQSTIRNPRTPPSAAPRGKPAHCTPGRRGRHADAGMNNLDPRKVARVARRTSSSTAARGRRRATGPPSTPSIASLQKLAPDEPSCCGPSPVNRSASSPNTPTPRACCSPTAISCPVGDAGKLDRPNNARTIMFGQMTAGSWTTSHAGDFAGPT